LQKSGAPVLEQASSSRHTFHRSRNGRRLRLRRRTWCRSNQRRSCLSAWRCACHGVPGTLLACARRWSGAHLSRGTRPQAGGFPASDARESDAGALAA